MTIDAERERVQDLICNLVGVTWAPFKITNVKVVKTAAPSWVPLQHRLLKFKVQITFGESEWRTVSVEVTTDELGSALFTENLGGEILSEQFRILGLDVPSAVPVMQKELQIAQKVHACLTPSSTRGHDLYDIQKILKEAKVDFVELARLTRQTFDARGQHAWPSVFRPSEEFKEQYVRETEEIAGAPDFDDALQAFRALLFLIDQEMHSL